MLAELIDGALHRHGERPATTDPNSRLTYRDLAERSDEGARGIHRRWGGTRRTRIGLVAANSTGYVVAYVAILRFGGVPFLIDPMATADEILALARDCGLELVVHDDRPLNGLAAEPFGAGTDLWGSRPPTPDERFDLLDDTEVCRFTSGSTGKPNCIEFSGAAVAAAARNWVAGTDMTGADSTVCFAALSNGLAFNTSLLSTFLTGASLHLSSGLPTGGHVSRAVDRSAATRLVGFPALYESLLRSGAAPATLSRVRIAISSGAPLSEATRLEFASRTGLTIRNYYGLAEAGPLTFPTGEGTGAGLGSPLPGVSLRAGTPDRPDTVRVRSESMGSRYLNVPDLFESRIDQDGYYVTGDQGHLRDNVLHLTGRSRRMINVGGRKIDPVEVADTLRGAPGVRDAVVFEDVDQHGSSVIAAAVATDERLEVEELRAHCRRRLAGYKVPGRIHVLAEIPSNAIGKPSLTALRSLGHPATT